MLEESQYPGLIFPVFLLLTLWWLHQLKHWYLADEGSPYRQWHSRFNLLLKVIVGCFGTFAGLLYWLQKISEQF